MFSIWLGSVGLASRADAVDFRRGDFNNDGRVDMVDSACSLAFTFMFGTGDPPSCQDAADVDDNGVIDLTDPIALFSWFYLGAPSPPSPGPASCGSDPTADGSDCASYDCGSPDPVPDGPDFTLAFGEPVDQGGGVFSVPCTLKHEGASPGAWGWSFGVEIEGGTVTDITRDGTDAETAALADDRPVTGGAVSATIIGSITVQETITSTTATVAIVTVELSGASGTLRYVDTLENGFGQTIDTYVVDADCEDFVPTTETRQLNSSPVGCDSYGLFFGPESTAEDVVYDITGDSFVISMQNPDPVSGFQGAVAVRGSSFEIADEQLGLTGALVDVYIADEDGGANEPVWNSAAAGQPRVVSRVQRGSTLTSLAGGDVFVLDLAPEVGAPGFTFAYVADFSGLEVIPATGDGDPCPVNEVLVVDLVPVGPPILTLGVPSSPVTLTPGLPSQLFRLEAPEAVGKSVAVTLTANSPDPDDANVLFLGWGEEPSPADADLAAEKRGQAAQRLLIPALRPGDVFLLVRARAIAGGSNEVVLLAEEVSFEVDDISSRFSGRGDSAGPARISTAVTGAGFDDDTRFRLVGDGSSLDPVSTVLVSEERAELVFEIPESASPGDYDLAATSFSGSDLLSEVFEVQEDARGAVLRIELSGDRYRFNLPTRLTLRYENVGNRERSAPMLKIVGPERSQLRLESEGDFEAYHDDTLLILAGDPRGVAGRLPPGSGGEVSIIYRVPFDPADPGDEEGGSFEVFLFTPDRDDLVGWDRIDPAAIPTGMTAQEWRNAWPGLSVELGGTWAGYAEALAERATRLARRAVDPISMRELFRFAVREALGRPTAALVGTVTDASFAPLAGQPVLAVESVDGADAVVSSTETDADGFFALDWLDAETSYELRIKDHTPGMIVTTPASGDTLALELVVSEQADTLAPASPNRDESGLPEGPLVPPANLFTLLQSQGVRVLRPIDPNCKDGPEGGDDFLGNQGRIRPDEEILYTITFTNVPPSEPGGFEIAAAVEVVVEDQLDEDLDWSSFRMREVRVGEVVRSLDFKVEKAPGIVVDSYSGSTVLERLGSEGQWWARCRCEYDPLTGFARWTLTTLDPATGRPPLDVGADVGFLPPNTEEQSPWGEGQISFTVRPAPGVTVGTEERNDATIQFDGLETVTTNEVVRLIGDFSSQPPDPPVHYYPPNDPSRTVEFDESLLWNAVPGATSYDVELVGSEGDFRFLSDIPINGYQPTPPLTDSSYTWMVTARNAAGSTLGDELVFTTVGPPPSPPTAPALPAQSLPDEADNVPLTPTLEWDDTGADSYEVRLWVAGEEPRSVAIVTEPRFQPPAALELDTDYNWQVVARNRSGTDAGPVWSFTTGGGSAALRRGDANDDGNVDVSDPIALLSALFLGVGEIRCEKAADADDSGVLDITDAIVMLGNQFLGSPTALPAPGTSCGADPTPDTLGCDDSACLRGM